MSQVSQSNQSPDSDLTTANSADCRDDIVRTYDLTKRYGDFTALDHCNVAVPRNEIFGLLGPNGAGKSTLIRLMLGFLTPTHGRCELDGCDAMVDGVALRRRVAYLPGDARLPTHMRGAGVMRFFADMHPFGDLNRSREVAELLELDTSRRVGFMSTGMRQKLALSVVFGLTTPLLILDEPTANLDPTVRGAVLQLVLDAQNEGRTIIFSSHVLSEIEDTCDQVVFLRQGLLAHQLRMRELFQRHRITADSNGPSIEVPSELGNRVEVREVKHGASTLLQIDTAGDLGPILTWINSLQLEHVRAEPLGLRTVYDSVHDGTKIE